MPKVLRGTRLVDYTVPKNAADANFVKGVDDKKVDAKVVPTINEDPKKPEAPVSKPLGFVVLTGEETNAQLKELLTVRGIKVPATINKAKLLELVSDFVEPEPEL